MGDERIKVPALRARVMVATPCYTGYVAYECAESMRQATVWCAQQGVVLDWQFVICCSVIQHARNWLTAVFLENKEYSHLLWLDADEGFEPNAIMKLIDSGLDVIGGVYPQKYDQPTQFIPMGPEVEGPIQRMRLLQGGFLMLRRHVMEELASRSETFGMSVGGEWRLCPHVFDLVITVDPFNPKYPDGKVLAGEDYILSCKLVEAGYELYARTDIQFVHVGRHRWSGSAARRRRQEIPNPSLAQPLNDRVQ
jgi:hypothetical protein